MRNFFTIWRRETASFLLSAGAYVTMVLVLVVTGFGLGLYAKLTRVAEVGIDEMLFWAPTLWLMVLIVASASTSRLFAEEKRSGNIEPLMTAPVTEAEVVLGKYAAALTFLFIVFAPTLLYVPVLRRYGAGIEIADLGAIASGYTILLLIGGFYVSVGLLISSLTSSQVGSAAGSFAVLCALFLFVGTLGQVLGGRASGMFEYLSTFEHIKDFSRGLVDTRPIVLYLSLTAFSLFATVKAVQSRRWI